MDNFISVNELSEILGYSSYTLLAMCRSRKIPCYRIGRKYMFLIGEIEDWLDSKKQKVVDKKSIKVAKRLRIG